FASVVGGRPSCIAPLGRAQDTKKFNTLCTPRLTSHNFYANGANSGRTPRNHAQDESVKPCYDECIGGISRGRPLLSRPDSANYPPDAGAEDRPTLVRAWFSSGARYKRACRGVNEIYRHFDAGLLPQGRGLPVGLSGAHPSARIHPVDRGRPLHRRLYGQLEIQRLSRNPRPHLRPALRAGLSARARREPAGSDLPPQTRPPPLQPPHPHPPPPPT